MGTRAFDATYIHTSEQADYYLMGFSDRETDFEHYVMLQLAYSFDEDDKANGMDGEYFEYGGQAYCGYKCVKEAIVRDRSILFLLDGIAGELDQVEVRLAKGLLTDESLDFLRKVLGEKLSVERSAR